MLAVFAADERATPMSIIRMTQCGPVYPMSFDFSRLFLENSAQVGYPHPPQSYPAVTGLERPISSSACEFSMFDASRSQKASFVLLGAYSFIAVAIFLRSSSFVNTTISRKSFPPAFGAVLADAAINCTAISATCFMGGPPWFYSIVFQISPASADPTITGTMPHLSRVMPMNATMEATSAYHSKPPVSGMSVWRVKVTARFSTTPTTAAVMAARAEASLTFFRSDSMYGAPMKIQSMDGVNVTQVASRPPMAPANAGA